MKTQIEEILPSFYFDGANVILTSCGHRHLRPKSMTFKVGQEFECPFEHDATPEQLKAIAKNYFSDN